MNDFEKDVSKKFMVKYAQTTSSGTAGLKVVLQSLGVGKGDEVITQSHTFIATVEAIHSVGAIPVIADIDETLNMNFNSMESLITDKTKAVIPVHMYGAGCDMDKILLSAKRNNLKVIEDSCQAMGGKYKNKYLGTIGDVGVYSFDSGKIIPLGEGGMIVTNHEDVYRKCKSICDHGHAFTDKPKGMDDIYCIGFNFKMSNILVNEGAKKFQKLDDIIKKFRENKHCFSNGLANKTELENLNFKTRIINDSDGDCATAVCMLFYNKEDAKNFVKEWYQLDYNTFNLPDAYRWHFAGEWTHIPMKHNGLEMSRDLLERTVVIPIKYHMEDINKMQDVIINNTKKNIVLEK